MESAPDIVARLRGGIVTRSAEEMRAVGEALARALPADSVVALHGGLGVGKTTFVQGLAAGREIPGAIHSPTYNIYSIHQGVRAQFVHVDAYRLESAGEVEALLLDEFLRPPYLLAVEWPEKIADWLPATALHLELGINTPDGTHSVRIRRTEWLGAKGGARCP